MYFVIAVLTLLEGLCSGFLLYDLLNSCGPTEVRSVQ